MINKKNSSKTHAVCSWTNEFILNCFDNWQHNSPRKARVKTSSIRLFHNNIPALDFSQTKCLVRSWQNWIPETVYQRGLNSAGWNYCDQRRRENTFKHFRPSRIGKNFHHQKFSGTKLFNVPIQTWLFSNLNEKTPQKTEVQTLRNSLKKNILVKVSWGLKNGRCKMYQRHHFGTWLHQALTSSNTAWKTKLILR